MSDWQSKRGRATGWRFIAAIAFTLSIVAPTSAADQWIEVKSAHFTVVSNASERATRKIVWQLEQVRSATSAMFSWAKPDLNKPLGVIVLKDENSMRAMAPMFWEERRSIKPATVWWTGPDQHYLVLRTDVEVESTGHTNPYLTSYFSYISLVLDQSLERDLPLWFMRGFAGVLSNTMVNDDHVLLGTPISYNLQILRERPIYPLAKLLSLTAKSPEANDRTPRETYDAEAWAFVHFLMFADEGKRSPQLNEFSKLVAAGKDVSTAFAETLGTVESLDFPFRSYMQRPIYSFRRFNIDVSVDREKFPVRPMTVAEAASMRATFHAVMNRPVEARAAIAEARKVDPNAGGSYVAEGFLADRENKEAEARAAYTKAAELNATNAYAYYRLASLTWQPSPSPDVYAAIEKQLLMAIKFNTRYAAAYSWLGEVRAFQGNTEAISLVRRAIQLDPSEPIHRLRAALVLLRAGKPAEARADAQAALVLADNDSERREAERMLEAVQKAEAAMRARSAPAATPAASSAARSSTSEVPAAPAPPAPVSAATSSPAPPAATSSTISTARPSSAPAPIRAESIGDVNALNTACQSGDNAACGKLLPFVESECAQKIGAACGFAGFLHERGRGVAANTAIAASFYNRACEVGDKLGCVGFAVLQSQGNGVIQNEAKAQATLSQLCQENVPDACTHLAIIILPRRTPADMTRARELLTKACDAKHQQACGILKSMK